ncbi:MAG: hypothetical protein RIB30_06405 [Thalassospira sp.]|uniref:hypothetical protein n=1 Tax=Thalassospira sp. TaxID=1912094 RepID=UPI0032EB63B2
MYQKRQIKLLASISAASQHVKTYVFACENSEIPNASLNLHRLPPLDAVRRESFLSDYDELVGKIAELNGKEPNFWYFSLGVQNVWNSRFYLLLEQLHRLLWLIEKDIAEELPIEVFVADTGVFRELSLILRLAGYEVEVVERHGSWTVSHAKRAFSFARKVWNCLRYLGDLCRWQLIAETSAFYGEVIFVSVTSNDRLQHDPYRDFLLGSLPEEWEALGEGGVVFAHRIGETRGVRAAEQSFKSGLLVTGFGDLATWPDALKCLVKAILIEIHVPQLNSSMLVDVSGFAKLDILGARLSEVAEALFYEQAIKRLRKQMPDAVIVHSWENQCWEHACRRAASFQVPTIGLQHSALLSEHRKMRASIVPGIDKPMPDTIISTGPHATSLLITEFGHKPSRIVDGFDLRSEDLGEGRSNIERSGLRRRVLVLLQGLSSQVAFHNAVAVACAGLSGWQITLRPHPAVPLAENLEGSELSIKLDEVAVSQSCPLRDDLQNHDVVIYSGSTAAILAVGHGLPVIHFRDVSALGNDPLMGLHDMVQRVESGMEMVDVCEKLLLVGEDVLKLERVRAAEYVSRYFRPRQPAYVDAVFAEFKRNRPS